MSTISLSKELKTLHGWKTIEPNVILAGYRGSISHGTYQPQHEENICDVDLISVSSRLIEEYIGLHNYEQTEIKDGKWDILNYDIKKFFNLLINANPNVLCLLWLPENCYVKTTFAGELLLDNRDIFSTKKIFKSFSGYARGQFHRMTRIGDPKAAYMGEKRRKLVEKYGYDTKNAAHLIRLLRMGIEFLNEGVLHVLRNDAPMLLEIKHGGWSLEKVKEEAERLFKLIDEAYVRSELPAHVDVFEANCLLIKIIKSVDEERSKILINEDIINGRR